MKPFIVGITGFAQSGKDTFAGGLVKRLGFKQVSFANALRRDMQLLNPIVGFNEDHDPIRVDDCFEVYGYEYSKKNFPEFRRLLQVYGTEVHRSLDENYWVNRATAQMNDDTVPGYVFTDVRFPNERTGVDFDLMVRIDRPGVEALNSHASEAHVMEIPVDQVIVNKGDMEDLEITASRVVGCLMYGVSDTMKM